MKRRERLMRVMFARTERLKRRAVAQSPGSLVHHGRRHVEEMEVRVIRYDEKGYERETYQGIPDMAGLVESSKVTWMHVTGLHGVEEISKVGKGYGVSSLLLEDVLNTESRAKVEIRDTDVFVVSKLVTLKESEHLIDVQHFALILLPGNVVLTFSEGPTDAFDQVISRIETNAGGRIRQYRADYLLWAILDAVVDHYLLLTDQMQEAVDLMDERLQVDPMSVETTDLYHLKRDIIRLQRAIRPIREVTGSLMREHTPLISKMCHPYLSDLNDHSLQSVEMMEDLKESSVALRDFYLSVVSNRMNEVMKVLTCFSTIFLPLTFLAGVYGMNFEKMPELKSDWGYPMIWVLFVGCAGGMFWLFKRMKWL